MIVTRNALTSEYGANTSPRNAKRVLVPFQSVDEVRDVGLECGFESGSKQRALVERHWRLRN